MPQTRAATAALVVNSTAEQPTETITIPSEDMSQKNAYRTIGEMLATVIQSGKLDTLTKQSVAKIIKIARDEEVKEDVRLKSGGEHAEVSTIRKIIREDLGEVHNSLEKKILQV